MEPTAADVHETLRRLRATPRHFTKASDGRSNDAMRLGASEEDWSVNEVLAHLRGAADVQGGWIARMLAEDTPTIRYASPRTGMRKGGYVALAFRANLRGFARQRADLVKMLAALEVADWSRGAAFTGTTPGWTRTVFEVASGIAGHEHAHFPQISAAAAGDR